MLIKKHDTNYEFDHEISPSDRKQDKSNIVSPIKNNTSSSRDKLRLRLDMEQV